MSLDAYYNSDNLQSDGHDNWVDQQEREHNKRVKLIEKFTGGWERYNKEPLFRNIVEALSREVDPYEIIEKLIDMNDDLSVKFRKVIQQWHSHIPPNLD